MSNVLDIDRVWVSYAENDVLEDVSFQVRKGEIFGLMGLNGAGKTTLIKCILNLRDQNSGVISVLEKPRNSYQSKESLAYLPEKFEPPWFLTGTEFIKFSLSLYKRPFDKDVLIRAAEDLALDVAALDRRVQTYSKGMRQKLGLLGTVLTGCPLLILDEPMSGLDPKARSLVKKMLLDVKGKGHTVFLSSHILADMDEICDRVALLDEHFIKFIGKPAELKKKTSTENLELAFLHYIEKKEVA